MALSNRLLSICPRISKSNDKLVAVTGWRMRAMTFGALYRKLVVDPKRKELILYHRFAWFFSRRYRLHFSAVEAVTYGYQDWALGESLGSAHNSLDLFSVGLRLHDNNEWHLFNFFGDGEFINNGPWPDWLYWDDYAFDTIGTQESGSRAFVDLISKMIGVTVVPASC